MHPKVLIVGTVPYNENTPSRAFDAYFHNWEKENLRQIFSNTKTPVKGHCGSLYQITDAMMLKRWLSKKNTVGRIYSFDDCVETWEDRKDLEVGSKLLAKLYVFGSKKNPFKKLIRKILWRFKYWHTPMLDKWLDDFKPECIFLAFSDDFFINEIALYVADKFNIPIMACIGDDYYFNDAFSISPLYHIYRKLYKKTIDKVLLKHRCSAIYISNKIRDKYNDYFKINGETVYLTSKINRHVFNNHNMLNPVITYCGNIRMGRNFSLAKIGESLYEINPDYKIEIYSGERAKKFIKPLINAKGIKFCGAVPYSEVIKIFNRTDVAIIVEGFTKKDVNKSRYSLSTKVADSLASGSLIFTFGSKECGVVDYMKSSNASIVCCNEAELKEKLLELFNKQTQTRLIENSKIISLKNHNLEESNRISEELFNKLVTKNEY